MARRPENRGTCTYCGKVLTRRSVKKHLGTCAGRLETLQAAESSSRPVETLWHLRVQDAYNKDFWLDLEMKGSAKLSSLDRYLRAIWLECCGHLSHFSIGGWVGEEIPDSKTANAVFSIGIVLRHLYDYGTTSETDVKVLGYREGRPTSKHPITLLVRNIIPAMECQECGQTAAWLCMECLYEAEEPGDWFLCDQHVEEHPHDDYGDPFPIVNSPRLGMCGYEGPAEVPY